MIWRNICSVIVNFRWFSQYAIIEKIFRGITFSITFKCCFHEFFVKFCQIFLQQFFNKNYAKSMNFGYFVLLHYLLVMYIQCFNSRDDNFPWNYFISKGGQFQTNFPQLLVDLEISNSYGSQYMSSIAPHKSLKIQS